MTRPDDQFLDAILKDAQSQAPLPTEELVSRILLDAEQNQPVLEPQTQIKGSYWSQLLLVIGGWPALSSVTAAGVAGLWIGLTPPDLVDTWVANALGSTTSVSFGDDFVGFEEGTLDG